MRSNLTVLNGRFLLQHKLGEGGMAAVWRAYDSRLQVWRAVKILLPEFAKRSKLRKRFETEAQAMALLEHPNIVRVYDVGSDDANSFIVMELCDGGSLEAWIEAHGPMPPRLAVDVALQVAAGIHAAHEHGVVHRDIKPQNVLLTAQGTCKVTDFGIAQVEDVSMTRTGTVMGTLGYMAPEQRSDAKKVDRRSDVYSVGATLFTLLTGRIEMDLFAVGQDPAKLEGIPPALVPVITHATAYHREERPASMRELGKALAECRSRLPPTPKSTPSLAPKSVERPTPPSLVEQALAQAAPAGNVVPPLPGETLAPAYDLFDGASIPPSLRRAAHERAAREALTTPSPPTPSPVANRSAGDQTPGEPAYVIEEPSPSFDPGRKRPAPTSLPWVPSAQRRKEEQPIDFESLYVKASENGPNDSFTDTLAPRSRPPSDSTPTGAPEKEPVVSAYDEKAAEKDPGKSAGRGLDAPWALKEAWRFLMQILTGLLQYASSPLQYVLWPLVAIAVIALIASFQGASSVVTAQNASAGSYRMLTTTLDRNGPELIDDLAYAGGNRVLLDAHWDRYQKASTPEEKRAAALALSKVLEETLLRLEETDDPREAARRKAIQGRIQAMARQRTEFAQAEQTWAEMAGTTAGGLAVSLGLASPPPKP